MVDRPSVLREVSSDIESLPELTRERIFSGARQRIRRRRLARRAGASVVAVAVIGMVSVWLGQHLTGSPPTQVAMVLNARGVEQDETSVEPGQWVAAGVPIHVERGGGLQVSTGSARVIAAGDTSFTLSDASLYLERGAVDVEGRLTIEGPSCRLGVRGRASAERVRSAVLYTLFAGTVEYETQPSSCHVNDLTIWERSAGETQAARAESPSAQSEETLPEHPAIPADPESIDEPEASIDDTSTKTLAGGTINRRQPSHTAAVEPRIDEPSNAQSALARQVEAFREALQLSRSDPQRGLRAWRTMRERYPTSPLRQEIDFHIVDTLNRTGRRIVAQAEAEAFVNRYPRSPRAAEMRRAFGLESEY